MRRCNKPGCKYKYDDETTPAFDAFHDAEHEFYDDNVYDAVVDWPYEVDWFMAGWKRGMREALKPEPGCPRCNPAPLASGVCTVHCAERRRALEG